MPSAVEFSDVPTPIGTFRIVYQGRAVKVVDLLEHGVHQTGVPVGAARRKPPFPAGSPPRQLQEYFRGDRRSFDVDLDPDTTSTFDRAVWTQLATVAAGRTTTYGELARRPRVPREFRCLAAGIGAPGHAPAQIFRRHCGFPARLALHHAGVARDDPREGHRLPIERRIRAAG